MLEKLFKKWKKEEKGQATVFTLLVYALIAFAVITLIFVIYNRVQIPEAERVPVAEVEELPFRLGDGVSFVSPAGLGFGFDVGIENLAVGREGIGIQGIPLSSEFTWRTSEIDINFCSSGEVLCDQAQLLESIIKRLDKFISEFQTPSQETIEGRYISALQRTIECGAEDTPLAGELSSDVVALVDYENVTIRISDRYDIEEYNARVFNETEENIACDLEHVENKHKITCDISNFGNYERFVAEISLLETIEDTEGNEVVETTRLSCVASLTPPLGQGVINDEFIEIYRSNNRPETRLSFRAYLKPGVINNDFLNDFKDWAKNILTAGGFETSKYGWALELIEEGRFVFADPYTGEDSSSGLELPTPGLYRVSITIIPEDMERGSFLDVDNIFQVLVTLEKLPSVFLPLDGFEWVAFNSNLGKKLGEQKFNRNGYGIDYTVIPASGVRFFEGLSPNLEILPNTSRGWKEMVFTQLENSDIKNGVVLESYVDNDGKIRINYSPSIPKAILAVVSKDNNKASFFYDVYNYNPGENFAYWDALTTLNEGSTTPEMKDFVGFDFTSYKNIPDKKASKSICNKDRRGYGLEWCFSTKDSPDSLFLITVAYVPPNTGISLEKTGGTGFFIEDGQITTNINFNEELEKFRIDNLDDLERLLLEGYLLKTVSENKIKYFWNETRILSDVFGEIARVEAESRVSKMLKTAGFVSAGLRTTNIVRVGMPELGGCNAIPDIREREDCEDRHINTGRENVLSAALCNLPNTTDIPAIKAYGLQELSETDIPELEKNNGLEELIKILTWKRLFTSVFDDFSIFGGGARQENQEEGNNQGNNEENHS